jgi:Na+/citrate or Na+/malate symporter
MSLPGTTGILIGRVVALASVTVSKLFEEKSPCAGAGERNRTTKENATEAEINSEVRFDTRNTPIGRRHRGRIFLVES